MAFKWPVSWGKATMEPRTRQLTVNRRLRTEPLSAVDRGILVLFVLLGMLLPWAAGCGRVPTELVSRECGVAITMPVPPTYEPSTFVVEGETLTNHQSRALLDGITYGFVCTPAPGLMDGKSPQELFDSMKQGWLIDGDNRLVTEHAVALQGHRGLELVMTKKASGETIRNRGFMFANAAINISVIGSAADVARPVADHFLDSLRLQN